MSNKINGRPGNIRVLVSDDHNIVRFGICSVIEGAGDMEVVGQAETGIETLKLYQELSPDVVLLDISMPGKNGIETTSEIIAMDPAARVLILTMHNNEEYLNQALHAGAAGFMLKNTPIPELLDGVRAVAKGNPVFSGEIANLMTEKYVKTAQFGHGERNSDSPRLTRREREILVQIADGKTSLEIAELLFISPRTVDTHRANLIQKLGVKNTAALVKYVFENDLLKPGGL